MHAQCTCGVVVAAGAAFFFGESLLGICQHRHIYIFRSIHMALDEGERQRDAFIMSFAFECRILYTESVHYHTCIVLKISVKKKLS